MAMESFVGRRKPSRFGACCLHRYGKHGTDRLLMLRWRVDGEQAKQWQESYKEREGEAKNASDSRSFEPEQAIAADFGVVAQCSQ